MLKLRALYIYEIFDDYSCLCFNFNTFYDQCLVV